MTAAGRIAIVTGANKGIGLAIVRNLATQYPESPFNSPPLPLTIYLTCRNPDLGNSALQSLLSSSSAVSSQIHVAFHQLDISNPSSITAFTHYLSTTHPEGIDILINNAGIALEGFNVNVVHQTLATNYHGTLAVCRAIIPLLRPGGRVVNVSSAAAMLGSGYGGDIKREFISASRDMENGVARVETLLERFEKAVKEGREKEAGFPSAAYAVSKAALTAVTGCLALQEGERGRGVLVNSVDPGYVFSDMTKGRGTRSQDQGAETPVMLALEDIKDKTGELWRDKEVVEWAGKIV